MKLFDGVFVRITHKIDRKNKVIMAKAEDCACLASVLELKLLEGSGLMYTAFKDSDYEKFFLKDEYTAKVRCVEGDEFDVEKGLDLVDEKLKKKLRRVTLKRLENRYKIHESATKHIGEGLMKLLSDDIDKNRK